MYRTLILQVIIICIFIGGCSKKNTGHGVNFTSESDCVIKGNIVYQSEEKIYHIPGCENYSDTKINSEYGERRFCSETEAREAGRRKARNCN